MALDWQINWNIEMARPLKVLPTSSLNDWNDLGTSSSTSSPPKPYNAIEVDLPIEIIQRILSYIPFSESSQKTLWACNLVSRAWYAASISNLYARPFIRGHNFQSFVATVCPSKNAHIRRSQLAELVRSLDMGELVHDGSKSLTARLLGRLKGGLTRFVAPQASFSVNSFAALSKCAQLTYLDLSLMSASIPMKSLFRTLLGLRRLETLFFPRTGAQGATEKDDIPCEWPPRLKTLHLAGGIDDRFLAEHMGVVPKTLERLSIQHCSLIYTDALQDMLQKIGPQLQQLTIRHPMSKLQLGVLDHTLTWCPNLTALRVSADYVSDLFFEVENIPSGHPLRILDLDCSLTADAGVGVSPDSIWIAVDSGALSSLRSVRVSSLLAWQATPGLRTSVEHLVELLEERELKDPVGVEPGVWSTFSHLP